MKKIYAMIITPSVLLVAAIVVIVLTTVSSNKTIHYQRQQISELYRTRDSLNNVITNSLYALKDQQYLIDSLSVANQALQTDEFYLLISLDLQHFWLKKRDKIIWEGPCATGRGTTVIDGDTFDFTTPIGERTVLGRRDEPSWIRPDWYWIEQGLEVPHDSEIVEIPDSLSFQEAIAFYDSLPDSLQIRVRRVPGALGKSMLNLGEGILIHQGNIGSGIHSHGCIRLKASDLEVVDSLLSWGSSVFIF